MQIRDMSPQVLRAYRKLATGIRDDFTIEISTGEKSVKIDTAAAKRIKSNVNAELRRRKAEGG